MHELCGALRVPALSDHGLHLEQVPLVADKAAAASSMKGNPVALTKAELKEILTRAC